MVLKEAREHPFVYRFLYNSCNKAFGVWIKTRVQNWFIWGLTFTVYASETAEVGNKKISIDDSSSLLKGSLGTIENVTEPKAL